jgi:Fe-S-cluster-containing hydrogenase component 2
MTEIFRRIARGGGHGDDYNKMDILGKALRWSNCVHGSAAPTIMLKSAEYFREEIDEHIIHGRCPAQVCKDLIRYEVFAGSDKLAEAAEICPTEAIVQDDGAWKIIDERCIRCNACREIAPAAIRVVDAPPKPAEYIAIQAVGIDARGTMQSH